MNTQPLAATTFVARQHPSSFPIPSPISHRIATTRRRDLAPRIPIVLAVLLELVAIPLAAIVVVLAFIKSLPEIDAYTHAKSNTH